MSERTVSTRQLKVGELIKRVLTDIFSKNEFLIEESTNNILVERVDASPDLKNVKVIISLFNSKDETKNKKIIQDLNKLSPKIRFLLAHKVQLKYAPELIFKLDDTSKKASKIEELIEKERDFFDKK